ncbi:MAG: hypothetical protein UY52_C0038G0001, partial [Parcubacteria group bacterium GW2011_GWC2_49_9]
FRQQAVKFIGGIPHACGSGDSRFRRQKTVGNTRHTGQRFGLATGAKRIQINQFLIPAGSTAQVRLGNSHHIRFTELQNIIFGAIVGIGGFNQVGAARPHLAAFLRHAARRRDDADEPGQKHEAMLSITGEKYGNMLNHTSLMVRPPGITNAEWEDIVKELKNLSGGEESNPGMLPGSLSNIDPRLLDAKVLDPYKKQTTTVREFIKGWSYIRIS